MGVVLGCLRWEGHDNIIPLLEQIRIKHDLKRDTLYLNSYDGDRYAVSIGGYWIPWNGGQAACETYVNSFLSEAKTLFEQRNITVKTYLTYLPM